ncbi:sodium- and chloride-dependent glycine transporter 2-like isoform X2 [Babylonia areolata]
MSIVSFLYFWYSNLVMSCTLYYLVSSFRAVLPWARCDGWWNTPLCALSATPTPHPHPHNHTHPANGTAFGNVSDPSVGLGKLSTALLNGTAGEGNSSSVINVTRTVSAAEEFWQHNVLQVSSGPFDVGHVVWYLALAQLAHFCFLFLALLKGIKSSGKVVYVTATAPYVLLLALLIRGATLPGAGEGILFYITPDFERLADPQVWVEAAIQVFFSLGPGWGCIITLSSYNKFHNNCFRDSVMLPLMGEGTSVLCGFTIFSSLGYMAHRSGVSVSQVVSSGPGLAFIVYPEAVSLMPLPQLWSVLFFAMIYTAGVDSVLACGESVLTTLCDHFPSTLLRHRTLFTGLAMLLAMLTSLIFVTQGGIYWYQLFDWFIATYSLTVIAIIEMVAISWVYGADRIGEDIQMMTGSKPPVVIKILWCFFTPLVLMVLLVLTLISYQPPVYGDYEYDTWAVLIGWCIATVSFLPLPIYAVLKLWRTKGSLLERVRTTTRPDDSWGPADPNRREQYLQSRLERGPRAVWLDILRT